MTYEKSFKEEAVRLSDEIGVKKAAEQLGVPYYTLADWRQQRKHFIRTDHQGMAFYSGAQRIGLYPQALYAERPVARDQDAKALLPRYRPCVLSDALVDAGNLEKRRYGGRDV